MLSNLLIEKFPQYIANSNDKKDLFYYHLQSSYISLRALNQLIDKGTISVKQRNLNARDKVLNCTNGKTMNSKKISPDGSHQRVTVQRLQYIHLEILDPLKVNDSKPHIPNWIDGNSGLMICVILDT